MMARKRKKPGKGTEAEAAPEPSKPLFTPEQRQQFTDIYRTFRKAFSRKKRKGKDK
jgi:hypothetical protein